MEECWHNPFSKEEIIEVLDAQVHPENAAALKPLEVKMTKTDHSSEKDLRYIGNAICGAGKGLAYLMEMLSIAEEKCLQEAPDDEGKLVLDEFEFDFP